jgi:hypothetical protein
MWYAFHYSAKEDLQRGGMSEGSVFLRRQRLPRDWRSATGTTVTQLTLTAAAFRMYLKKLVFVTHACSFSGSSTANFVTVRLCSTSVRAQSSMHKRTSGTTLSTWRTYAQGTSQYFCSDCLSSDKMISQVLCRSTAYASFGVLALTCVHNVNLLNTSNLAR